MQTNFRDRAEGHRVAEGMYLLRVDLQYSYGKSLAYIAKKGQNFFYGGIGS